MRARTRFGLWVRVDLWKSIYLSVYIYESREVYWWGRDSMCGKERLRLL